MTFTEDALLLLAEHVLVREEVLRAVLRIVPAEIARAASPVKLLATPFKDKGIAMPPNPYQRIIVHGIPVWKDAEGRLYYYETSTPPTPETRIQIGTEATGLNPDLKALLEPRLRSYRENSVSRARAAKN